MVEPRDLTLETASAFGAAPSGAVFLRPTGFVISAMKGLPPWQRSVHLALSVFAPAFASLLIQTVFAFHYAREYYARDPDSDSPRAGIRFPGHDPPDYFAFMYFAFVIGMTSQVSDVVVTGHDMLRTTLIHGILSFIFDVAVVAMSVNIISSAL